jgi:UDP-N-acetylglucosamine 2-epimerase (non-hydrolysing)
MKENIPRVISVFGTRPEAIKMAPVLRELAKFPDRIVSKVCVTAQHRQMLDQVLELFDIQPDYDMNVMEESQTPTKVAASVMTKLEPILQKEQPDWVLVQGDTTTMMAASVAAFYARVKVAHVEAGLRTHNKWQPFPEEINRRIAGVISDLHFAPTERARQNLLQVGISDEDILVTGNTVIDALHWVAEKPFDIKSLNLNPGYGRLIMVTAHRRENFGQPLENICLALREIAERYADQVQIVYPMHLNPNVQEPVNRMLGGIDNISLLPPLDYLPFIGLMKHAYLVLTDSGGVQEEAPGLGKPVLVLRDVTERPEAVEAGTVKLVGTDCATIRDATIKLLEDAGEYKRMSTAINPYGDGLAAMRITKALLGEEVSSFQYKEKDPTI